RGEDGGGLVEPGGSMASVVLPVAALSALGTVLCPSTVALSALGTAFCPPSAAPGALRMTFCPSSVAPSALTTAFCARMVALSPSIAALSPGYPDANAPVLAVDRA